MPVDVGAVMRHVNNYFEREAMHADFVAGDDGHVTPRPDAPYIAVYGSKHHDGVYKTGTMPIGEHEAFTGIVWGLYPPKDFIELCEEIAVYCAKNPVSGMLSESFGAYTYTRASGKNGPLTWQEAFADRLRPYRRMFTGVSL